MKILVTGATGFIGNQILTELTKSNHTVIATSIESNIDEYLWKSKVKYISCDLAEKHDNYYLLFDKPDILIHLAWEGLPNYTELFHYEKNLFDNYFFLKNCIMNGLKDLSVIGTCFEYGITNGQLHENMETNPTNPYGLAKDTLRKFIQQLNTKVDFNFKWIRLFYMFGEKQNKRSILKQLETAIDRNDEIFNMSGGEQLRDYLPVEKVSEYILKIACQKNIQGIINCCSGTPISVQKLVKNHLKKLGKKIILNFGFYPYQEHEAMAFWGNNTILNKILNKGNNK